MDTDELVLRPECPADAEAVVRVLDAAFRLPESEDAPVEVGLVRALRADDGWLPDLCLVAEVGGSLVGQVTCTRGWVGAQPAIGLGPLGVIPSHQGRGVGQALMTTVLRLAASSGERLVALLGDPAYYGRFGFVPAADQQITPPDPEWASHFQVAVLNSPPPTGTFRYAAPFHDL